jgi:hypothetical protein
MLQPNHPQQEMTMAEPTLETLVESRFEDIQKRREELLAKRAKIDEQLHAVEDEYHRVKIASDALAGKFKAVSAERKLRAPSTRATRGARGELREKIRDLIRQFPEGITAKGINTELQATDKASKQRIANLLTLMLKDGSLERPQARGPYTLPKGTTNVGTP